MNITQLINLTRLIADKAESEIDDDDLIVLLNICYQELIDTIVTEVGEHYFYDSFTADLVADQNEYTLQEPTGAIIGINKILRIDVKKKNEENVWTKLHTKDSFSLDKPLSTYETGNSDFFTVAENSIFVYPTPTEAVAGGLVIQAIKEPIDITDSFTEDDFVIPRKFIKSLAIGAKQFIYSSERLTGDKNDAITEWELEKGRVVQYLSQRVQGPTSVDNSVVELLARN